VVDSASRRRRGGAVIAAPLQLHREAIDLTRHAKQRADAALIVLPYYIAHAGRTVQAFQGIHDELISIIIYNVPPRCAVDMTVETCAVASCRTSSASRIDRDWPAARHRHAIKKPFCQLSGEDATALASVNGGTAASRHRQRRAAPLRRDAERWHPATSAGRPSSRTALPLHKALFCESSPGR